MNGGPGLMSPGVVMSNETSAEAEYKTKNRIIKECLVNEKQRAQMNEAMSMTIGKEVYDYSLARVLLQPRLVHKDACPVYSEGERGPAVVVHLVQSENRVLGCRAFRDSVREEEQVTTVRDIDFFVMRGDGIRPSSFPLSNVVTLRWPELNGHAYSMVERARQRMRDCLALDETRVALRAIAWVCNRFAAFFWVRSAKSLSEALKKAIDRVGPEKNPVILCSILNMAEMVKFCSVMNSPKDKKVLPLIGFEHGGALIPVYPDTSVADHAIYVLPSGMALGEMPIFIEPQVQDYDKPERLIKGWLVYQDQGMVFVNVKITNVIYLGWKGLIEMGRNLARRVIA